MQVHLETLEASKEQNGWVRTALRESTPNRAIDDAVTGLISDEYDPTIFYLVDVDEVDESDTSLPLAKRWMEICGTPVIPFGLAERKRLEHKASKQISKVLQARREMDEERKKKRVERDNQE
jgi:hypothetical protein